MSKNFNYTIGTLPIDIHAEKEGDCRYMVRLSCAGKVSNVRIGYLTGSHRKWLAEFFGARPSVACKSAKEACEVLAKAAIAQPGIASLLHPRTKSRDAHLAQST